MGFLKSGLTSLARSGMFGLVGNMIAGQPKPPSIPKPPQMPDIASALSAKAQLKAPPPLGGTYLTQSQGSASTTGGKSLLGQ